MPSDLDASLVDDASIDAEIVRANDAGVAPQPTTTPVATTTSAPGTNLAGGGPPDCHLASGGVTVDTGLAIPFAMVLALLFWRRTS